MAATAAAVFRAEFARHLSVAEATAANLEPQFARLVTLAAVTLVSGGKLIFFGNGGSAADAQHLATELSVRYRTQRKALPAIALGADGVLLTAAGNDLGFEQIFARQIEALGRPGDLAIALSTSGRSPNVIAGLQAARAAGLSTAAMGGGTGGMLPVLADPVLLVPAEETSRIQEMHITLGHMLCLALERELGLSEA
ncbi:MAG: gmhA [Geminicoccaceae bacterium]|nr:gmhA [Geminicoccaceae bacterium]